MEKSTFAPAVRPKLSSYITVRGTARLLLILVAVFQALAQQGAVEGVVTDKEGALVPSAAAQLLGRNGALCSTLTDPSGLFRFSNLAPGGYRIRVEMPGYAIADRNLTLTSGRTAALGVTLQPSRLRKNSYFRPKVAKTGIRSNAESTTYGPK